jgi:lysozyme
MNKALEQLKRHEGFKGRAYKCTAGRNTIAFGYNLDANSLKLPRARIAEMLTQGVTEQEAEGLLIQCVEQVTVELTQRLSWFERLNEARRAVLINMAFNLGIGGLMAFKGTLHAVSVFDFDMAAKGMLASRWASQVHGRANELALQMKTGEFANGA